MTYVRSLIIVLLANQAAIAAAAAGHSTLREPSAVSGQKHSGHRATEDVTMTPVKSLDRVATAVDSAESSHSKDISMWRPDPSGPQGPMQVSEAAATDVGGGDRFDLTQNRAIGRAYLAWLYRRYKNWPDAIAAYNWGLSKVDIWITAGRPAKKLLPRVAAYTTRVLRDSGLCSGAEQLWRSATFEGDPEFQPAVANPLIHLLFSDFDFDGRAFSTNNRYFCGVVPTYFSKTEPLRLQRSAPPLQSRLGQITAAARSSWRIATHRAACDGSRGSLYCEWLNHEAAHTYGHRP